MNTTEIIKLFREFERYDKYTRDYGINDTKAQRFNSYLSKMKCVIEEIQKILDNNNIDKSDNCSTTINDFEVKAVNTATTYYFKLEKHTITASSAC